LLLKQPEQQQQERQAETRLKNIMLQEIRQWHDIIVTATGGLFSKYRIVLNCVNQGIYEWNSGLRITKNAFEDILHAMEEIRNIIDENYSADNDPTAHSDAVGEAERVLVLQLR
jgi:hypothetical protein